MCSSDTCGTTTSDTHGKGMIPVIPVITFWLPVIPVLYNSVSSAIIIIAVMPVIVIPVILVYVIEWLAVVFRINSASIVNRKE